MNKKFYLFGLAALVSVSLFLAGCPTETEEKIVETGYVLHPERTVDDQAGIVAAFEEGLNIVAFAPPSTVTLAGTPLVIPAGKTLQIFGGLTTASGAGLVVEGTVYVEGGTLTTQASTGKVTVKSGGRVEVRKGGTLSVDAKGAVVDDANTPAPTLGERAVINGGTLAYVSSATEVQTVPGLLEALGFVSSGLLDVSAVTLTSLKPSDIAGVAGISPSKRLVAQAAANEGAGPLLIPAGAIITVNTNDPLSGVTGAISVAGELNIGANTALALGTQATISTSGTGKVVSTTTTSATLANLLSKAGSALNIEQGAAVELAAATEVKAGTVLTLKSGNLTVDSAADKKLTVAGKVVVDGGGIALGTTADTGGTNPAIKIPGSGRIEAGGIVISGAGSLWDATSSTAKTFTITKNQFLGVANSEVALKGATTINAGNGKVILGVDGGGASDTGTFLSAASSGLLTISATATTATIGLDNDTAVADALKIKDKGSLTVGAGGIIAIKGTDSTLTSDGSTAKLSIAQTAKLEVDGVSTGTTATFTKGTSTFGGTGTFTSGHGDYIASNNGWN